MDTIKNEQSLEELYQSILVQISNGLCLDEANKPVEAVKCYYETLASISDIIRNTPPSEDDYRKYLELFDDLRKQVLMRIADIESGQGLERHPIVEEADSNQIFSVIFAQQDIEIFRISTENVVGKDENKYELQILMSEVEPKSSYIKVADWTYPLISGVCSIWCNQNGSYIFPAVYNSVSEGYVGISFPDETWESRLAFESLVKDLTKDEVYVDEAVTTSQSIASALEEGGQTLGRVAVRGAEFAGEWIVRGGSWIRSMMPRTEEPTCVNRHLSTGMGIAVGASNVVFKVSGYVGKQIGYVTSATGGYLAPYVKEQGTNLVVRLTGATPENASSQVDAALVVAGGAVSGASTLYHGLETAGKVLATCLASSTVAIVQHRHGSQAASLAGNSFVTLFNLVEAGRNVSVLRPSGLVKNMAKSTGEAVLKT